MTRSDIQPLIDVVLHVDDSYRDTTLKMKTYVHFHICYWNCVFEIWCFVI